MKKRIVDLRNGQPLLPDIGSYGRAVHAPTPAQRLHIALTVRRAPEVMVKVSGGARVRAIARIPPTVIDAITDRQTI